MGLSGVEPLTSPLSGVRSNQLSYRPLMEIVLLASHVPSGHRIELRSPRPVALCYCLLVTVCSAFRLPRPFVAFRLRDATLSPALGGADRDRTGDLLNANQALSQLSYSPMWFDVCSTFSWLPSHPLFPALRMASCLFRRDWVGNAPGSPALPA